GRRRRRRGPLFREPPEGRRLPSFPVRPWVTATTWGSSPVSAERFPSPFGQKPGRPASKRPARLMASNAWSRLPSQKAECQSHEEAEGNNQITKFFQINGIFLGREKNRETFLVSIL